MPSCVCGGGHWKLYRVTVCVVGRCVVGRHKRHQHSGVVEVCVRVCGVWTQHVCQHSNVRTHTHTRAHIHTTHTHTHVGGTSLSLSLSLRFVRFSPLTHLQENAITVVVPPPPPHVF
jgi:hypothetical protein